MYTPYAATMIAEASPHADDISVNHPIHPENVPLCLPSAFPAAVQALPDMKRICNMESRLRHAQAYDALAQIRRQRRIIQGLWQFKKINISGTGNRPNTRVLATYKRLSLKLTRVAHEYRTACRALQVLDPDGDWQEELKELRNEDISGPGRDPDESNGRFVMSWIWLTQKAGNANIGTEADFNETMRVEWTKARARMKRWQEEMRRVVAWFEWKADWWEQQATRRTDAKLDILQGISAYAYKQANLFRHMATRCAAECRPMLASNHIIPDWAANYPAQTTSNREKSATDEFEDDSDEIGEDDNLDFEETRSDIDDLDYQNDDSTFSDYED